QRPTPRYVFLQMGSLPAIIVAGRKISLYRRTPVCPHDAPCLNQACLTRGGPLPLDRIVVLIRAACRFSTVDGAVLGTAGPTIRTSRRFVIVGYSVGPE